MKRAEHSWLWLPVIITIIYGVVALGAIYDCRRQRDRMSERP